MKNSYSALVKYCCLQNSELKASSLLVSGSNKYYSSFKDPFVKIWGFFLKKLKENQTGKNFLSAF